MMEAMKKQTPHWWWFDSHKSSRRSPWLQSTLTELDDKTKAMLKLIEEDADSFAQRAEMYYKKRPELINMVEDFYRAHRSLAERYDQIKSESGPRLLTSMGSPFSSTKYRHEKLSSVIDHIYDSHSSYSETFDSEESAESEVDDPEQEHENYVDGEIKEVKDTEEEEDEEEEAQVDKETKEDEVSSGACNDEVMKLREEIEKLKEENRIQNDQLLQKEVKDTEEDDKEEEAQVGKETKEDEVSSGACNDEVMKLREEIEKLKEENRIQNDQLLQKEAQVEVIQVDKETKEVEVSSGACNDEVMKLREEIEKLKEENRTQNDQLLQKDEEKREVIRQLSIAVEVLKVENMELRKCIARESPKKRSPFEFSRLKGGILGMFFNGSPNSQTSVVAL